MIKTDGVFVFEAETLLSEPNIATLVGRNCWIGQCRTCLDNTMLILNTLSLGHQNSISVDSGLVVFLF